MQIFSGYNGLDFTQCCLEVGLLSTALGSFSGFFFTGRDRPFPLSAASTRGVRVEKSPRTDEPPHLFGGIPQTAPLRVDTMSLQRDLPLG